MNIRVVGRSNVRNVFRMGDSSADRGLRSHAGLGEGIVTRVKVFAILLYFGEHVLMGGELAVEAEELLLLLGQSANVNLLALSRQHCERYELERVEVGSGRRLEPNIQLPDIEARG